MENKKKSVIGIVSYPTYDDENYYIVAMYDSYTKVVLSKGCIPYIIPHIQNVDLVNTKTSDIPPLTEEEKDIYREMIDSCDGLFIPGGNRIYEFHKFIASYAIEKNIPILGTCLGMQVLACVDNVDRCLETNPDATHKQRGVKYVHKVKVINNTLLSKILGESEIEVNSVHQQHVTHLNKFIVSAYSTDGLIEAIELPEKTFVIGVQWHPEKMTDYDENANKIIDAFISECNKNRLKNKIGV